MSDKNPILIFGQKGQVSYELISLLKGKREVVSLEYPEIDLGSADSIRRAVKDIHPSLLINAAAYTNVDQAEAEQEKAMSINGHSLEVMGQECKKIGAPVIHYSTDYVFNGESKTPYLENDPTDPINYYGETKLFGEKALEASGADYAIFRISWVYGLRGHNFLLTMKKLAQEREQLKIIDDQVGSPTWAKQVAISTVKLTDMYEQDPDLFKEKGGIYHLVSSDSTTWYGFTEAIVEHLRAQGLSLKIKDIVGIPTSEYPTPAKRPHFSHMDSSKAESILGLKTPSWMDQLKSCMETEPAL